MPPRSKVLQLPEEVRRELEQKLIGGGFSDYNGLAEWLIEQGFEISRSALHRWGKDFEERVAAVKLATDQMRALAEAADDPEGLANAGLLSSGQELLARTLIKLEGTPSPADVSKLVRAIADIGRASVTQQRFTVEAKRRAREEMLEEQQRALAELEGKGFDPATLAAAGSAIQVYLPDNQRGAS